MSSAAKDLSRQSAYALTSQDSKPSSSRNAVIEVSSNPAYSLSLMAQAPSNDYDYVDQDKLCDRTSMRASIFLSSSTLSHKDSLSSSEIFPATTTTTTTTTDEESAASSLKSHVWVVVIVASLLLGVLGLVIAITSLTLHFQAEAPPSCSCGGGESYLMICSDKNHGLNNFVLDISICR